ncbi:MAG TPA: pilus assembly protein PilM [Terriglobales bacterium]|nr:pilus assembly protein PilM [Terriglobales bacterium]
MLRNNHSARPKLACEIAPDRVIAARAADSRQVLDLCSTSELAPGCVVPDLTESNVRQREMVVTALRRVLEQIGGRSRDVVAILPDAAVRVVLLDFDTLPDKSSEAESVVRFRLKKSLPFDVDKAAVSYHAQTSGTGVRVIAAVALNNVVQDYEAVFTEAGFSPGVILPSMLAALGGAAGDKGTLVIKVDAHTTSIAILDKQQLLLFRTLENARGVTISGEQLAEDVYPSVVFFQDTYSTNIEEVYVAGISDIAGAAPALQAQTGAEVRELVRASQLGLGGGSIPKWRMAGVVGALLS